MGVPHLPLLLKVLVVLPLLVLVSAIAVISTIFYALWLSLMTYLQRLWDTRPRQPPAGCVFVSGCDSGMGQATALHLAERGWNVIAGVYVPESVRALPAKLPSDALGSLSCVVCDITDDASVAAAARAVARCGEPLYAVVNCAGLGFTGPAEYFPLDDYRKAFETNLLGYIRVVQAMMPLVREACAAPGGAARRGRFVFIGTGGGVPSPSPGLLSAYMASKWGIEAFCQSLRVEMQLTGRPIDCCMVNPGFIKPTNLIAVGNRMVAAMWGKLPARAREEYGGFVANFQAFSAAQPGTHVSKVAQVMEEALAAGRPPLRYKVGYDSMASPLVGLLPSRWKEWVLRSSMYAPPKGVDKKDD